MTTPLPSHPGAAAFGASLTAIILAELGDKTFFMALTLAAKPADRSHHYGHFKAEYGLSGLESVLIAVAAFAIIPDPPIVQGRPLTQAWSPSRGPEAARVSSIRGAR